MRSEIIIFSGSELKVTGTYNGETFKAETIEPLHEGGQIIIPPVQRTGKPYFKNNICSSK